MNADGAQMFKELRADDALPGGAGGAEVYQEAEVKASGAEVVHALGMMDRQDDIDGFDFDEEAFFDEEVGVIVADAFAFVEDGEVAFGLGGDTAQLEFFLERAVVNGFEEAYAEGTGNFNYCADDRFGERVVEVGGHGREIVRASGEILNEYRAENKAWIFLKMNWLN